MGAYEEYAAFIDEQMTSGAYHTIPHCDSRILHHPQDCEYCRDATELQSKRAELGIAWTGRKPLQGEIPCEADAKRPPGADNDHRRWGGNKPTSAKGDDSWPEETFASRVMYGELHFENWDAETEARTAMYEEGGR
jgi:hypothetical protein